MQARIISIWATDKLKPPWFEIEATFFKLYCPINLLDERRNELPGMAKDNFLITTACSVWDSLRKFFGTKHNLNCLTTLIDNPKGTLDLTLRTGMRQEFHHVYDLWDRGKFKTFESLQAKYKLQTK